MMNLFFRCFRCFQFRPAMRTFVACVSMAIGIAALANPATDKIERARVESERKTAEADFAARDRECRQHFEVTSCVDAVQRERREVLKHLRVQQELLDEAARRERAAQRLESIRQKESGADAKQREAMARQQQKNLSAAASGPSATAAASGASAASKSPATRLPRDHLAASPQTTAASAAVRATDYADRQHEVADHRAEVARRNAERAAKGKKSVPLPVPTDIPPRPVSAAVSGSDPAR